MAQFPPQQCHGSKTPRNSSSIKSGISLYSSETVFFYKIFQKFVVFGHFGPLIITKTFVRTKSWTFAISVLVTFNWITITVFFTTLVLLVTNRLLHHSQVICRKMSVVLQIVFLLLRRANNLRRTLWSTRLGPKLRVILMELDLVLGLKRSFSSWPSLPHP